MKLKRTMRAWKKRNWTEHMSSRALRHGRNRMKSAAPVSASLMAVPDRCWVYVHVPGRLLAKSKVRAR